jgi:hypothetical protein
MVNATDIKVQRGSAIFGASADLLDITIDALPSIGAGGASFCRMLGTRNGKGRDPATTAGVDGDDLSAWLAITSTTNLRIERPSAAANVDHEFHWEVWSYEGPAGGADEFKLRASLDQTIARGGKTNTSAAVASISSSSDVVAFASGAWTMEASKRWDCAQFTRSWDVGTDKLIAARGGSVEAAHCYSEVVEFTGSNWTIDQVSFAFDGGVSAPPGTTESATIASVGAWRETLIVGGMLSQGGGALAQLGFCAWEGSSATELLFQLGVDALDTPPLLGDYECEMFLISNPTWFVDSLGSLGALTGTEFANTATSRAETVADVGDMESATISMFSHCKGTGTAYARGFWSPQLTATDTVTSEVGRTGVISQWTLQVARFGVRIYPTVPALSISAPAPTVSFGARVLLPTAIALSLTAPAPVVMADIVLTPDPLSLSISAPAPAALLLPLTLSPPPLVLTLTGKRPGAILLPLALLPAPLSLLLTAPAPAALLLPLALLPAPLSLSLTAPAPAALVAIDLAPTATQLLLSAPAPQLLFDAALAPPPLVLSLTAPAPTLRLALDLLPAPLLLSFTAPAPIVAQLLQKRVQFALEAAQQASLELELSAALSPGLETCTALAAELELADSLAPDLSTCLAFTIELEC